MLTDKSYKKSTQGLIVLLGAVIILLDIKQPHFYFGNCYHLLGEEIDFSSLRNEFSNVST